MKKESKARVAVRLASRELVVEVYRLTATFPQIEKFRSGQEIRKIATTMSSHISEGSSRPDFEEQTAYLLMAYESLVELMNKIIEARKKNIIPLEKYALIKLRIDDLAYKIDLVSKPDLNKS